MVAEVRKSTGIIKTFFQSSLTVMCLQQAAVMKRELRVFLTLHRPHCRYLHTQSLSTAIMHENS